MRIAHREMVTEPHLFDKGGAGPVAQGATESVASISNVCVLSLVPPPTLGRFLRRLGPGSNRQTPMVIRDSTVRLTPVAALVNRVHSSLSGVSNGV